MVNRRRVSSWPTYLLKDIPESGRRSLSASAAAQNTSIADVIRSLLCARYHLTCPRESNGYDPARDTGSQTVLLRLQPKLAKALTREAAESKQSKRQIILDTITDA